MERTIIFKNFEYKKDEISADLYLEDKFVIKMTDKITHLFEEQHTYIGLYECFKEATLSYMKVTPISKIQI